MAEGKRLCNLAQATNLPLSSLSAFIGNSVSAILSGRPNSVGEVFYFLI
ncbi:hypothetical protein K661_02531 [Piscirickettsia salmonis LF-89 = ATCC VR-1361]|nr:hypothetical protein K661_02531 [Piscirickettsia salmonis LF-89 = ATCC VR-1361]